MKSGLKKIGIVDYGVGNLYSVEKAVKKFTDDVFIVEDADKIKTLDGLILPGTGSFQAGMDGLKVRNLTKEVISFAKSGKPVLGICLGAQILLTKGYEFGEFNGLGLISGKVTKFSDLKSGTKIPHIGWNRISFPKGISIDNTIFKSVKPESYAYFVHSYVIQPDNKTSILAETVYGGHKFCSVIRKGNIYGCQFHPEKSGEIGLGIIKNFVSLVKTS